MSRESPKIFHYIDTYILPTILNPLNAELNPTCHLLALLGAHHILYVSTVRVNIVTFEPHNSV